MLESFLPQPSGGPHPRPDHPLQDSTRLRFLTPRPEPPEGISTVRADLSAFFVVVDRVGRNEALLLLLAKALRQRTGLLALRVNDLAWMLRVSNRRVIHWLDRLTRSGHVIYHVEDLWGIDTVLVEIVAGVQSHRYERTVPQELPTHCSCRCCRSSDGRPSPCISTSFGASRTVRNRTSITWSAW